MTRPIAWERPPVPLPRGVAEQDRFFGARALVAPVESAADGRTYPQHVEERCRDARAAEASRFFVPGPGPHNRCGRPDPLERAALSLHVAHLRLGEPHRRAQRAFGRGLLGRHVHDEPHNTPGILIWQRLQQEPVHDAEDRGVRADAEAERQHGDRRKSGILLERSQRMPQVSFEILDPDQTARFVESLFRDRDVPERSKRLEAGVLEAQPVFFDEPLHLERNVAVELFEKIFVGAPAPRPHLRPARRDRAASRLW